MYIFTIHHKNFLHHLTPHMPSVPNSSSSPMTSLSLSRPGQSPQRRTGRRSIRKEMTQQTDTEPPSGQSILLGRAFLHCKPVLLCLDILPVQYNIQNTQMLSTFAHRILDRAPSSIFFAPSFDNTVTHHDQ